ncbi:DUF4265 domain-containing protein [Burkholderia sp. Ac-20365]|jgi:hypothetical protein|uniref:DUF4265 domain-containing protein n=1 Tax=Burkholderia sp. Ac-20365 TaxID=2703897 RepID=UPI00197B826A|nr:DUF4265 domain-containing protein [Burkholderia sp. Ac-20365]MBN3767632.1 DUF4265 domain-containing protein [Burkholderia sp. Ac-20365]
MSVDKEFCLIHVFAGFNESGPVYEELHAKHIEADIYELLASPGLTLNLAKGDVIRLGDADRPANVLERGGNFCIQIYTVEASCEEIERLRHEVTQALRGSLDGVKSGSLALSIPSSNGVEAVNRFFDEFKARTGHEWYYANIYKNFEDPDDETLLDWWTR